MKNLIFMLIFSCAINMMYAQTCNNRHVAVSPDGLSMYFTSDRDVVTCEIYKSDINGNNVKRLTNSPDKKSFPSVSSDGTKLLFQSEDYSSSSEIYIMNTDGTNLVRLTNNSIYDGYPNFSPDGQSIVFSAWDNTIYPEIFTMHIDGSNRSQITNIAGSDWNYAPKYNPSGTKIYYLQSSNGNNHIVMMDLDGSNLVSITPTNTYGTVDLYPSFTADGTKMVFSTSENTGNGGKLELYTADVDGQNWQKITACINDDNSDFPVFDPLNNSRLFFTYNTNMGKSVIKQMHVDGTNVSELAICSSAGVSFLEKDDHILLSPNPAQNYFSIDLISNQMGLEKTVKLNNSLGQTVFTTILDSNTSSFEFKGDLNPGIYFVQVFYGTSGPISVKKLVIRD